MTKGLKEIKQTSQLIKESHLNNITGMMRSTASSLTNS